MAKRKKRTKAKKKLVRRPMPKEEEVFYVGLDDPRMLRRTILEATRDGIQSLQQFESFKAVRAEKHEMLLHLKADIQDLRVLIKKLRKTLPKTKLRVKVHHEHEMVSCKTCGETFHSPEALVKHQVIHLEEKKAPKPKKVAPRPKARTGLDRLEAELDTIESQLTKLS